MLKYSQLSTNRYCPDGDGSRKLQLTQRRIQSEVPAVWQSRGKCHRLSRSSRAASELLLAMGTMAMASMFACRESVYKVS
jgi:hypothetical protein